MSTSPDTLGARPGLSNVVDIVVSPPTAFDRLRVVPTWGWAFLIATLLGVIGSLIVAPAIGHAMETSLPAQLAANAQIAKLPPDQQASMIAMQLKFAKIIGQVYFIFVPIGILVVGLVQGLIMLIANAAARGDGSFKKLFALSVTISVVGIGLNSIVLAVIVMVRGANSFETTTAITSSLPSLALLAPGAHGALAGFLGAMNVFNLWATGLLALGMARVARIPGGAAWGTAIVMLLVAASFAAFGAARNG